MGKHYTAERNVLILIALLKSYNIRKIIASPGTTNIALVASLQYDPYFEMYSAADERSAAYMACGLAAESGEPVVLSCTGATASRNYIPGLTEAYYRKLPVLAITSTQSLDKIGHLIPQVIDRRILPNDIAVMSVTLPTVFDDSTAWACEVNTNKALAALNHRGGGPVHINLVTTYNKDFSVEKLPAVRKIERVGYEDVLPVMPYGRKAVFIGSHVTWSDEDSELLDKFCAANDAVVFCDHTSNYKGKYRILYPLVLCQEQFTTDTGKPDLLIHIGEISGAYADPQCTEVWRISPDGEFRDTFHKLHYVFEMSENHFFRSYTPERYEPTQRFLQECRNTYAMTLASLPDDLPFSNIWIARKISMLLPNNSVLHLGILNTLRSWNFFEIPASVASSSNVGGFGIDGDVSTLIGASLANRDRLYFGIFGDLAFFYDMNVLGNRHVGSNLRIMLINNGRGTEFRQYNHPAAAFGDDADEYMAAAGHYGNKSQCLVRHYAEDLGFEYLHASDKEEFEKVYSKFLSPERTSRPIFFEIFTDNISESDALKMVRNCRVSAEGKLLDLARTIIPPTIKKKIKQALK